MATARASTSTVPQEARRAEHGTPRLGLRFEQGRAELVLDAPLALESGARLDAMRTELAPIAGRFSLAEGWRAFRHRRSTLVEARVSIGLRELGALVGRAIGLDLEIVALGASALSIAASNDALALAVELAWGWDEGDALLVLRGARSLPRGPRAPLALAHDLGMQAGAVFDRARGALRVAHPLRALLMQALVPAGLRLPSTVGLAMRAVVEGDRLVLIADRTAGGVPEAAREALEHARAMADALVDCVDREAEPPPDAAPVIEAAAALDRAIVDANVDPERLAASALAYAQSERHAVLASSALLAAGERARGAVGARLAASAIERGGLVRPAALARAILAAAPAAASGVALPWERLTRMLEAGGPMVARARALALEGAGRPADALLAFADAARADAADEIAQLGIARVLTSLGRHDEAISAWDRVAQLTGRVDAKHGAARAALASGRVDGGIARLRAAAAEASGLDALAIHVELAAALARAARLPEALSVDHALPRITDGLGPIEAEASGSALRAAIDRALEASDLASARGLVDALARVLGAAGADELAVHEAAIARAAERTLASADPAALRAEADALRAEGRSGEAARVLVELFARTKDAAVLRAAIELADRSTDREGRLAVFDRALALLPHGPARDAIAARR